MAMRSTLSRSHWPSRASRRRAEARREPAAAPRPQVGRTADPALRPAWLQLEASDLAELFGASALELGLVAPQPPGSA